MEGALLCRSQNEAQMLIPSTSAEKTLGTRPCFYLSPSSSEVTKAKEELFRALTDMFSSCRAGLAGKHAQKLHQINGMMLSHCQPALQTVLPYARAPFTYSSYRNVVVWQNPAFRDVGLLQAQRSKLDKYQILLRNPITGNVMEKVLVIQKSLTFHRSSLVWMTVYQRMQRGTAGVYEKSITYLG